MRELSLLKVCLSENNEMYLSEKQFLVTKLAKMKLLLILFLVFRVGVRLLQELLNLPQLLHNRLAGYNYYSASK